MKRFTDWFNNLYPVWLVSIAVESDLSILRQAYQQTLSCIAR